MAIYADKDENASSSFFAAEFMILRSRKLEVVLTGSSYGLHVRLREYELGTRSLGLLMVVPLFLTEVAPIQHRGAVNILFQLFVTIGIFIANLVNYVTSMVHPYGWRLSLGLASVPAFILFLGSLIITESPPQPRRMQQRNRRKSSPNKD
ncbi:MFS domain-containing protein [Forsythia ovata]|uniref:MFS domain-containing protein n=1 Tax=Forsythia ovata TaxID=205694 RepID=A0ABD1V0I5_9LAMI